MRSIGLTLLIASFLASSVCIEAAAEVPLFADQFERVDVIAIERDGRDLFGFDSLRGRSATYRLEVSEEVFFLETRGRVGLVLTNRRALAIGPGTGFREIRYQPSETPPETGLVGDQIALVSTSKRVLGFIGSDGRWVEEKLSPSETPQAIRAGKAVGVVVTNRRALGLSAERKKFTSTDLRVRETLESVAAQDTLATLRTNKRILVFGSPRGTWTIQDRSLR